MKDGAHRKKERKRTVGFCSPFLSLLHQTQLNKTGAEADNQKPDLKVSPTPTRIQTEQRELSVCGCVSRAHSKLNDPLSIPDKGGPGLGFFFYY